MRNLETQNESCLSCRFWANVKPVKTTDERVIFIGQCRKASPTANADGSATWPAIAGDEWCAEYEQGTTPNEAQRFL